MNRPDLTAEKFIRDPFADTEGARLYRTGDLVRYLPDGNLEFLGRIDHQVKIRGHRIELGEIEVVLSQHPGVKEAAVIACDDPKGDKRLVAYFVARQDTPPSSLDLRNFLRNKLPAYMVPAHVVSLAALPVTVNGKIDRNALPIPDQQQARDSSMIPRTSTETDLAEIWAEVLGLSRVGIHDNFFDMGGHSLAATQVLSRVRDLYGIEVSLRDFFESPTVADMARMVETGSADNTPGGSVIPPAPHDAVLPLSFSQERVWFIQQLDPANMAYNFQATLRLRGVLDVAALKRSLSEIVRRHEIYRTTFPAMDGRPVQVVHDAGPVPLPLVDLQALPERDREMEARRLAVEEFGKPFDLTRLPLVRWTLLRLNPREHLLLQVEHHLVHDGWSFNVFLRELQELYRAFVVKETPQLADLPIQFSDFAHWQRQWIRGEAAERQLAYWKQKLADPPPVLALPSDRPRPAVQRYRGSQRRFDLSVDLCEALRALSRREGVTLFMTLLGVFQTLLHRYTQQSDFCVGSAIANRRWRETEGLIGMIVNTVALRADLAGNPSFRELLGRVRRTTLDAYANQDLPFDKVVEALRPERSLSHSPIYQVLFTFHDAPMPSLELPELTIDLLEGLNNGSAKFDLNVAMIPRSEQRVGLGAGGEARGVTVVWEYSTDLFDETTVDRMLGHFQTLLESVVANPGQRLSDLPLLTEAERQQQLVEWNNTKTEYPAPGRIHELFEAQVDRTPDAVAVVFGHQSLTYQELNGQANRLARHLRSLGVGPDVLVGICVERSMEMVVGLLGILKAGGAYVPLDPAYPNERLAFIMEDTQASVLLTQQRLIDKLPSHAARVVCLDTDWQIMSRQSDRNLPRYSAPDHPAYIIYTSGSTGKPKGVAIEHRSAVNLLHWARETFSPEELTGVLASTSFCFDLSVFELFVPLSWGGKAILADNILHLSSLPSAEQVTLINTVPSGMAELVRIDGVPSSVRTVCLAGEPLTARLVEQIYEKGTVQKVFDLYGPSETTTYSTFTLRTPSGPVTIGRPVANTRIYILDHYLDPVPIGVPGELHIGGAGLARGYLNRLELTAEKFIPSPLDAEPGARLYKTGDLARYLPDGNIEFLGRIDHQVKIRGHRIELGEVEAVLRQHSAVCEAVALAREDTPGDKRLVAYIVPRGAQAPISELRDFLGRSLPNYMVPSAFVALEALPLTPNGKVDRKALPVPDQECLTLEGQYAAPQEPMEYLLAQIWEEVLGIHPIGIRDNFFELGGHSLLAVRLMDQIGRACGKRLPLAALFRGATIEQLAQMLFEEQGADFRSPLVKIQSSGSQRPFFFLHGDFGGAVYCLNLARSLGKDQPFYALAPHGLDDGQIPGTIEAMAASHIETLRAVQPEGPYLLGGYCNGGVVAFEMAQQLQAQGQQIDLLVLIASSAWNARFNPLFRLANVVGHLFGFGPERRYDLVRGLHDRIVRFEHLRQYYTQRSKHFLGLSLSEQMAFIRGKARGCGRIVSRLEIDRPGEGSRSVDVRELTHEARGKILLQAYRNVLAGYVPSFYRGRVALFWPNDEPRELQRDVIRGWRRVAADLEVHMIPGNHLTIITTHVKALGDALNARIACRRTGSSSTGD
ncbi:MAG TPA: amino acid adenylation domain-containing protein [Methylomirabilota bacterium]|nr:amino acid adenylation domain-containing protein [Methylomirabilota bacterium]